MTMRILAQSFWLPKAGNTLDEYEDDYDFSYNRRGWGRRQARPTFFAREREMKKPRFAVADGATESSYSGIWAHMLVRAYVARGPRTPKTFRKIVETGGQEWTQEIMVKPLPWYAEDKARRGSHTTFVGLSLIATEQQNRQGGRWTALAVGDSCLFQIRKDTLITRFPVERADEFGYHPRLLSTIAEKNRSIWEQLKQIQRTGEWLEGDTFLLMTDAVAQWFLAEAGRGAQPWQTLRQLVQIPQLGLPSPPTETGLPAEPTAKTADYAQLLGDRFQKWVNERRTRGMMNNDDVTLLLITIGGRSHETTAIH